MKVLRSWDDFEHHQREAIIDRLRPWLEREAEARSLGWHNTPTGDLAGSQPILVAGFGVMGRGSSPEDELRGYIGRAEDYLWDLIGGKPADDITVVVIDLPPEMAGGTTGLLTVPDALRSGLIGLMYGDSEQLEFEADTPRNDCHIMVDEAYLAQNFQDGTMMRLISGHEMFHCWSWVNSPTAGDHILTPEWYQEGLASWIGERYAGQTPHAERWWRGWLDPALVRLFWLDYPAIGLWAWLEDHLGDDLFESVQRLHQVAMTGDHVELYGQILEMVEGSATSLAASRSLEPSWGPAWNLTTPGDPPGQGVQPVLGGIASVEVPQGMISTEAFRRPEGSPDLLGLRLELAGYVRARWNDGTELVADGADQSVSWCLAESCECEDGYVVHGWAPLPDRALQLTVALTGAADRGASASMQVESLCEEPEPPPLEGRAAPVLYGEWKATVPSIMRELDDLYRDIPGMSARYGGGSVLLTFQGDRVTVTYDDLRYWIVVEGIGRMPTMISGGGTLRYGVVNGTDMMLQTEDFEVIAGVPGPDTGLSIGSDYLTPGPPFEATWNLLERGGLQQLTLIPWLPAEADGPLFFFPTSYQRP